MQASTSIQILRGIGILLTLNTYFFRPQEIEEKIISKGMYEKFDEKDIDALLRILMKEKIISPIPTEKNLYSICLTSKGLREKYQHYWYLLNKKIV